MGVTGLWTVLQPCARPIKIETLNKKRLAVDASIWIYQFLKAVRDKEGNALRNSHVVGFFRRICKLLFFGIKPVFVFDGGAPALKRQTISNRKARREGRRDDAVRTAGKLLALQMQRRAEEEERKRREERDRPAADRVEEEIPENLVYVDELHMTPQERLASRQFKKKDAYHLPNLDVSLSELGAPNDPRIMSQEELEEYARQFHTGEDVNVYDFSKIDFNSPFFLSLPASDRYNILNAARLRSRLRMGYSKDQLDNMFPDRMAFSRFQIERVKERNELTQRLMNINGMNDDVFGYNYGARVAGERGKEYVLVKNDGVEGGWALGVVSNRNEGDRSKPIDVDKLDTRNQVEDEDDSEEGFEDVPIEGLNRLPKLTNPLANSENDAVIEHRRALYEERRKGAGLAVSSAQLLDEDPDSLFLPHGENEEGGDVDGSDALFEDALLAYAEEDEDEDEQLRRAIALSLEDPEEEKDLGVGQYTAAVLNGPPPNKPLQFSQKNAEAGRAFAHLANMRAIGDVSHPFQENSEIRRDITQNQSGEFKAQPSRDQGSSSTNLLSQEHLHNIEPDSTLQSLQPTFDGPLPFESLNLRSIFTKKKKKPVAPEEEGGFEKNDKPEAAQPLPPWFSGSLDANSLAGKDFDGRRAHEVADSQVSHIPVLKQQRAGEIIDLDAPKISNMEVIEVTSSSDGEAATDVENLPADLDVGMNDVTDLTKAAHPISDEQSNARYTRPTIEEDLIARNAEPRPTDTEEADEEPLEWDESDLEENGMKLVGSKETAASPRRHENKDSPHSSPPEFEDVELRAPDVEPRQGTESLPSIHEDLHAEGEEPNMSQVDFDYSDEEDEDLMRQLAIEAEEHARFASSLNAKSQLQSAEDYERELRQLRNQQKKDRRDADEVSHIMITECQQLLKLFGLPYITAPMEAEAQCAELVSLGLVDGIVTDDSDIFLFGGTRVYKNMFNQAKFVECYLASDLEKEYSLTRERIIQIAHLLGSDYTEGLPSVGPVTALEILSEFEDLESFRDWWSKVQAGQKMPEDNKSAFRKKFRKNAARIFISPTFPDKRVDQAYLHPEVDSDPSPFAWGVPDLDALRQFLMATIGWSQERADEILVPVIRDMNRRENEGTQANITQFFSGTVGVGAAPNPSRGSSGGGGGGSAFAPRRRTQTKSRRMESALDRLHNRAENSGGADAGRSGSSMAYNISGDETSAVSVAATAAKSMDQVQRKTNTQQLGKRTKGSGTTRRSDNSNGNDSSDDDSDGNAADDDEEDEADDIDSYKAPKEQTKRPAKRRKAGLRD